MFFKICDMRVNTENISKCVPFYDAGRNRKKVTWSYIWRKGRMIQRGYRFRAEKRPVSEWSDADAISGFFSTVCATEKSGFWLSTCQKYFDIPQNLVTVLRWIVLQSCRIAKRTFFIYLITWSVLEKPNFYKYCNFLWERKQTGWHLWKFAAGTENE